MCPFKIGFFTANNFLKVACMYLYFISFFFASKYSKLYMYHNWLNYSPIEGYLDSLQFEAIKDKTVNIRGQVSA